MLRAVISRRSTRSLTCRLLAVVLLCAQWALAHACPGAAAMSVAHTMPAGASMADCDGTMMDDAADAGPSALCAEHCHQGQQSDAVPVLDIPPVDLAILYPLPPPRAVIAAQAQQVATPADALGPAPPPHEIAHCCFRI